MLGIRPAAGRFFHADDEKGGPNASPYVVLSYDLWQSRFHGDPNISGQSIRVSARPYTILGVAPQGFHGTESGIDPALWIPSMQQPQIEGRSSLEDRGNSNSWIIVRGKPGTAQSVVEDDLNRVVAEMAKEHPDTDRGTKVILSKPGLFGTTLRGPVEQFGAGVLFLGGLVLLAACVNLAALLGARAADRFREIALALLHRSGPEAASSAQLLRNPSSCP